MYMTSFTSKTHTYKRPNGVNYMRNSKIIGNVLVAGGNNIVPLIIITQ
ncbi:hypothetical protein Bwad006_08200 [Bilophila wadsworthia]